MLYRHRMSSKRSLFTSWPWIVCFVAVVAYGSEALRDDRLLLAEANGNLTLELPQGNGTVVNKTLRIADEKDEISFTVRRPKEECFVGGGSYVGNSVEFWLGDSDACKMRMQWSNNAFGLGKGIEDEIVMKNTKTDVLVTLKKDGNATVSYKDSDGLLKVESIGKKLCNFALNDNLNKEQGGKTVKFSMQGKIKCGLKLEFDKSIVEQNLDFSSTVSPKANQSNESGGKKHGVFNSSLSLNWFIFIVIVSVIIIIVAIAVAFYFCCWKLLLRRANGVDIEAQNTEMKAVSSAVDYSGMPLAEKTCVSPTKGTVEKTCISKTKEQTEGKAELKGAVKQLSAMGSATDVKRISKKSKHKSSSSVSKQTTSRSEKERREYNRKLKAGEEMTGIYKRLELQFDERKKFDAKVASGVPLTARERYLKEMHEIRARYEPKLKKEKRKRHAKQKKMLKDPDRRPMKPYPHQKTELEIQYQRECAKALDRQLFEPADAPHTDPIDWDQVHEEMFARRKKRQEDEAFSKKKLEDESFSKKKLEDESRVKKNKQNSEPIKKKKEKSGSGGKPKKRSKSNRRKSSSSGTEKKGGKRSDPKTP